MRKDYSLPCELTQSLRDKLEIRRLVSGLQFNGLSSLTLEAAFAADAAVKVERGRREEMSLGGKSIPLN